MSTVENTSLIYFVDYYNVVDFFLCPLFLRMACVFTSKLHVKLS